MKPASALTALGAVALGLSVALPLPADEKPAGKFWVFVGTYTGPKSKGIYRFDFDAESGKLTGREVAAETPSPSFLAISADKSRLFCVGETADKDGNKSGGVVAFALDPKAGTLKPIGDASSGGAHPCHLVVDKAGKNVLVANYTGGNVGVLAVGADGKLAAPNVVQHKGMGHDPKRQEKPHAHSINLDAAEKFAIAADLGLDEVKVYRFDAAKGTLSPNEPAAYKTAPGAGPRHFAFHPDGKHAFVINELNSTLSALAYDAEKGILTETHTLSTLPADYKGTGNSTAEVVVHPSGKFVYGSNRGHNSIAVFAYDAATGKLTPAGHQGTNIKTPRNFACDPTGKWLLVANQSGDSICVFGIDAKTGALTPAGDPVEVPSPVCVRFLAR